ncbi:MAG: UTRA domain-containing protein [Rhodobacteraceae bacterium]|nr:UTRA domain-containing protein [Paracoccaceae bacterium]
MADPVQALALQLRPGAALLRSVAVNVDAGGVPVELGTTWFAGDRVTLTVGEDSGASDQA